MSRSRLDSKRLQQAGTRLGEVLLDPATWPQIMEEISAAAGATGAVLLQSDTRTVDIPRTAGVREMIDYYFANGWHTRDLRAEKGVPLLLRSEKVVTDQDILTPEEMSRSDYYQEAVVPFGFRWFAAVGFAADSALWALVIQRTLKEGAFTRDDKRALGALAQRLSETATLSKAVGQSILTSLTNAFDRINQPAVALHRMGLVLNINSATEALLDDEIFLRNRRLVLRDKRASSALAELIDRLQTVPDNAELSTAPIVVRRRSKGPLVIRALPIDGAARSPFLGARMLLLLSDLSCKPGLHSDVLARAFGLSPAEARLASLVATGASAIEAADRLGLGHETVRTQLKAIFAKTQTHRQSQLAVLLSQL